MANQEEKPKFKPIIEAADHLSLGVSMVVAILMGIGIGILLKKVTDVTWTLWIGVFIGIAAAILNVYKVYVQQQKEYNDLANEPRYKIKRELQDEDEDELDSKNY
ncbi:MAG: AtpZ/AtpI family protein [Epsilonproteobacteria bacterium]|nr:AtpZ/AtpI family protein [Campylobacterota bacterium]